MRELSAGLTNRANDVVIIYNSSSSASSSLSQSFEEAPDELPGVAGLLDQPLWTALPCNIQEYLY